jgi:hypothetical protein
VIRYLCRQDVFGELREAVVSERATAASWSTGGAAEHWDVRGSGFRHNFSFPYQTSDPSLVFHCLDMCSSVFQFFFNIRADSCLAAIYYLFGLDRCLRSIADSSLVSILQLSRLMILDNANITDADLWALSNAGHQISSLCLIG